MLVDIDQAAELIKLGQIVCFPTETVYGIGADATNDSACKKIFDVKQRPNFNPLIVHVSSLEQAGEIGVFDKKAILLAEKFWPGPLTIVLRRNMNFTKYKISNFVTSSLPTIALRLPSNEIAKDLIKKSGTVIAAPSANKSGSISSTCVEHILKHFPINLNIIDGGKSIFGLESTIIDLSESKPKILRHGFIDKHIIETILEEEVTLSSSLDVIKAPGMMKRHYAPNCKIRINVTEAYPNEIAINFGNSNLYGAKSINLSFDSNLSEAASKLYDILFLAEEIVKKDNLDGIAFAQIPQIGVGVAINDKLIRASS